MIVSLFRVEQFFDANNINNSGINNNNDCHMIWFSNTHFLHSIRNDVGIQSIQTTQTTTMTSPTLLSSSDDTITTPHHPKIPITLPGGYLGSGKTSTLQNLLTNNGGLRTSVIVNDMASVNIDQKLIVIFVNYHHHTGRTWIVLDSEDVTELKNGCVCVVL